MLPKIILFSCFLSILTKKILFFARIIINNLQVSFFFRTFAPEFLMAAGTASHTKRPIGYETLRYATLHYADRRYENNDKSSKLYLRFVGHQSVS